MSCRAVTSLLSVPALLLLLTASAEASAQSSSEAVSLSTNVASRAVAVSGQIAQASPLSFNFGIVDAGSSSGAQGLQVSNIGDLALHISAINSSDPAFIVTGGSGQTIAPGGSLMFPVYFSPTDGNAHSGTLSIMS